MEKTDVLKEIKVLCVREDTTLPKAVEGICTRQSLYRTIRGGVVSQNIVKIADKLGYDVEVVFTKK